MYIGQHKQSYTVFYVTWHLQLIIFNEIFTACVPHYVMLSARFEFSVAFAVFFSEKIYCFLFFSDLFHRSSKKVLSAALIHDSVV